MSHDLIRKVFAEITEQLAELFSCSVLVVAETANTMLTFLPLQTGDRASLSDDAASFCDFTQKGTRNHVFPLQPGSCNRIGQTTFRLMRVMSHRNPL